jgi:hypothetical protein
MKTKKALNKESLFCAVTVFRRATTIMSQGPLVVLYQIGAVNAIEMATPPTGKQEAVV